MALHLSASEQMTFSGDQLHEYLTSDHYLIDLPPLINDLS